MDVGHLPRYADLVVVEIGEVLFAIFGVIKDLRQRFVAVLVGVEIGIAAFVGVLRATGGCRPRRSGCVWGRCSSRRVCLGRFVWRASAERVVGVCPDFGVADGLFDFGADKLIF